MKKTAKLLPTRSGLNALVKTDRTINDYAKASPVQPDKAEPSVIQNLRPITKVV